MSFNQGSIATHSSTQTLPSFAQAFSSSSLSTMPAGNNISLPPIHHPRRVPSSPRSQPSRPSSAGEDRSGSKVAGKKRSRAESEANTPHNKRSGSDSPPYLDSIKQEPDQEMLDPHSSSQSSSFPEDNAPPSSSVYPSASKKRRVTISGAPVLNTDVRAPSDPNNATPISPVVIGFTIQRDNPSAVEAVRSMLSVKQKQKALIEQRRGSVAGVMSPNAPPSQPGGPGEDRSGSVSRTSVAGVSARSSRRSPNSGTSSRRQGNTRPPSPIPVCIPTQLPPGSAQTSSATSTAHSLPPPPISFARRRANQLGTSGRKPADIVISPREDHTPEQFAPSIQSAPPVPHAGQGSFGRYPMSLPRLPSVLGGNDPIRRTMGGNVPPTPTRLATMQVSQSQSLKPIPAIAGIGRSPPNASVPISATHVPPTPSSLHYPGYSGGKTAFLAPFEMFYDALNDSKQLKGWLSEQLQRSNALIQNLTQQQEKLNDVLENLVEKKVAPMRMEMAGMRRRIEELEDSLRYAHASSSARHPSFDAASGPSSSAKGKQPLRNGGAHAQGAMETYTFPPVDRLRPEPERVDRMRSSPGWGEPADSETGSPASFAARRLSVSASRLDPPTRPGETSHLRGPGHSPPSAFRETPHPYPPPPPGKMGPPHPGLARQPSNPRIATLHSDRDRDASPPPPSMRREEGRRSRRNSIGDDRDR